MSSNKNSGKNPNLPVANSTSSANKTWNSILKFFLRFERFIWDIGAILALAIALMTLLALLAPNLANGNLLKRWRELLIAGLGGGSFLVVITTAMIGIHLLRRQARIPRSKQSTLTGTSAPMDAGELAGSPQFEPLTVRWDRVIMLEIGAFACLALMSVTGESSAAAIGSLYNGGIVGWGLAELLRVLLNPIGMNDVLLQSFIWGAVCLFCWVYGLGLSRLLIDLLRRWTEPASTPLTIETHPAVVMSNAEGQEIISNPAPAKKRRPALPAEFRKRFRLNPEKEKISPPPPRDDRLPPLSLLIHEQGFKPDERNINMTAGLIEKTLSEFGIPARVIGFRVGPTVTQFAVEPGFLEKSSSSEEDTVRQKVRVSQISSLQRDLALALSAERLRIEAPVPGRPYVGIEVPNMRTSVVRLRPILENEAFYKVGSPLSIALGRDVSGQPVVADLMKMPHLLIAGTTGSGKSVCIASLTACLVMNNTPQDLRLVMIDPKMVELVRFNGLPHLYGKVETDLERILGVLRWVVIEMDHRYKLLEEMRARHIDSYNRKVSRRKGYEPMPRIVVMIDELADLMMSAPDQTEHTIIRLAQMARATGIHLVIATQRPSTDVVTGLIKANFPARIAFAVASSIDSRVILDTTGAESLLGQGDMLFLPPEASAPQRTQGVMISDQEIEHVITFWQKNHPVDETASPPWEAVLAEEEFTADKDDLVLKAVQIVRDTQRASASMLQRRLRIGYPRAARLVDELEQMGVVGPSQGGGREREVFIGPDDELPFHSVDE